MIILPKIKTCGIYLILNINNKKIYIGSSKDMYYRLHRHKSDLLKSKYTNPILLNSFKKGSIFVGLLLEYCSEEDLRIREQYYIDLLNPEYNITRSVIRNVLSTESRVKISETLKEKYKSGEITAYKQNHNWIKVDQFTLDGKYIKTFDSIVDAAKENGISRNNLNECIRLPHRNIAGGYIWKKYDNKST